MPDFLVFGFFCNKEKWDLIVKVWKHFILFYFLEALKIFFMFIFERERQTECEWRRCRERERETQNSNQAPGSELSAQSPTWGLNSRSVRS